MTEKVIRTRTIRALPDDRSLEEISLSSLATILPVQCLSDTELISETDRQHEFPVYLQCR